MSRFDDLDQNLKKEAAALQSIEEERKRKLFEAREKCMPQLERAYSVFGDYYTNILQPKGYILIPRRKESLSENEKEHLHSSTVLYAYVANIVSPVAERPYQDDASPRVWRSPTIGELDYHNWNPNVALHFAAVIKPHGTGTGTGTDVDLSVEMRAWGKIEVDKDALAPQGITVGIGDAGWDHYATSIIITPDDIRLEDQISMGLRLLTPNVIHHKDAFRKQFS